MEPALPVKIGLGASQDPQEVVRRVTQESTRLIGGQHRAAHARMLHRVRLVHTILTVMETLKGPAQIVEGVLLVNIVSGVCLSRRETVLCAQWDHTRPARDPRPA